jgi:hypothetical protein
MVLTSSSEADLARRRQSAERIPLDWYVSFGGFGFGLHHRTEVRGDVIPNSAVRDASEHLHPDCILMSRP